MSASGTSTPTSITVVETRIFEFHFENRNENIIKKDQLLKIGDLYEKDEIKDRKNLG